MSKTHASLSPETNRRLIFLWAFLTTAFLFLLEPRYRIPCVVIGAILGVLGGWMQRRSIAEAPNRFVEASSALSVRRALTSTRWGRIYIFWLYFCQFFLMAFVLLLVGHLSLQMLLGDLAAYGALMFCRDLVTFRDTILLHRLQVATSTDVPTEATSTTV